METSTKNNIYPFSAIVGQDDMKRALLLNVINPKIGGVLIRGEKGTAKSTAVRALASCSKNPMKVINLPVSATEDRVVGTLDIEYALKHGEKKFEPGILKEAHKNILYVDEINLLDDHIVDILLDAAAMGVNSIEREGISYSHPSKFVLVGTMNPEEGDLRPQLIDRFGLVVDVQGEDNIESRVEIVKRRLQFEENPIKFINSYEEEQLLIGEKIENAKELLDKVTFSDNCIKLAAEIAITMGVDGHRADITLIKTAITNAALMGRTKVNKEDMLVASKLALPHRMRRKPFEEGVLDFNNINRIIEEYEEL